MASLAKPFEQIAAGKNFQYALETVRVEGTSGWQAAAHDQSALVLDREQAQRTSSDCSASRTIARFANDGGVI